jgi:hypothetical protein
MRAGEGVDHGLSYSLSTNAALFVHTATSRPQSEVKSLSYFIESC